MTGAIGGSETSLIVRETGIRPLEIMPLPDGGIAFLELSRRFYVLGKDQPRPLALSCLPGAIPAELYIGAYFDGSRTYVIASGPEKRKEDAKIRTGVLAFDFRYAGAEGVEWIDIQSKLRFQAAAGDAAEGKIYLLHEDGLYVADMNDKKPKAELLSRFDEPVTVSELHLFPGEQALIALDRENSTLYGIDLLKENPAPRVMATDLGLPAEVAVPNPAELLLLDTTGKRVLKLDCSKGRQCTDPKPFISIPEFRRPVSMAVDTDGGIWVGDLDAQSIFAFDPQGKLIRTLDSITGFAP
jgi:hypothetical protein